MNIHHFHDEPNSYVREPFHIKNIADTLAIFVDGLVDIKVFDAQPAVDTFFGEIEYGAKDACQKQSHNGARHKRICIYRCGEDRLGSAKTGNIKQAGEQRCAHIDEGTADKLLQIREVMRNDDIAHQPYTDQAQRRPPVGEIIDV